MILKHLRIKNQVEWIHLLNFILLLSNLLKIVNL